MPLTAQDAFKVGFLARCAEDGCTPAETLDRVKLAVALMEKRAFVGGLLNTVAGKALDVGKSLGGSALGWGIPLAIAGPPVLGGIGGYALSRATDIDDTDVEDIKNQELLEELSRQTDKLKRQRALRDRQQATLRPPRGYLH